MGNWKDWIICPPCRSCCGRVGSRYAEEAAIGSRESTYTYAQLVSRVKRRVAWLNTLGLAPGAHIAVLAPNDLNAMELFLTFRRRASPS